MRWFKSINAKMTALLLGMMALSLILAAVLFVSKLSVLQEKSAHEILKHADMQANQMFEEMELRLRELSREIVSDENLIASLSLITNYEDRANYQPLIFDPPKQEIATILQGSASNAAIDIAVIYDTEREPIAFYLPSEGGPVSGYFQYQSGVPKMMHSAGDGTTLRPPQFLEDVHLVKDEASADHVHFHVAEDGTIFYDIFVPIIDDVIGDSQGSAPTLRLGYHINRHVIESIAARSGASIHLRYGDNVLRGGDTPQIEPNIENSPELSRQLAMALNRGELFWEEFRYGEKTFLRGVTRLEIAGEGWATLSYIKDSASLSLGVVAMQETLLWLMPLIAILLIPVGQLFANRTVTKPVKQLIEASSNLGMGRYELIKSFKGSDELVQLAKTFNKMSMTIKLREDELRESRSQFEGIVENAPAIIYMKDLDGRYLLVNEGFQDLVGKTEHEIVDTTDFEHFPNELAARVAEHDRFVLKSGGPLNFEETTQHRDGTLHTYHSVRFPLKNANGQIVAICGISTDISERKQIEQNLTLARLVIENANEAIVITDLKGIIVEVNEAYEKITGFTSDEVIGRNPNVNKSGKHDQTFYKNMWQRIVQDGRWEGEIWDRRKNGEVYPKWLSITTVYDDAGEPTHYVGIFSDITQKKQTEEELERLAYYDPLTELPNRMNFHEQLRKEVEVASRNGEKVALLFLDLDRFKYVNDTLGHNAGDELLVKVAQRLKETVRQSDTVSRLGGDEFTVILRGIERNNQVATLARKVVDAIAEPFTVLGSEVHIGTSVGASVFPDDGDSADTLIKNADMAMYQAKEGGRNDFRFYSEEMQARLNGRLQLEEEIRLAIVRQEFELFYQPKVHTENGDIHGMEALVRWKRADGSMVSPAEFIPVAEETGLIVPMGQWILTEACRQTSEWNERYALSLKVAVNLSARQFADEDVVTMVQAVCKDVGLDTRFLELEITESMVMGNVEEAITTMGKLRSLGVSLAIDDFGTGYSSLNYLKRFPIHTLKIDQSFIRDLQDNSNDAPIVRAIISMAHSLELSVVAEGVEEAEQLAFLRAHHCELAQGYYLHRPLASADFEKVIEGAGKQQSEVVSH